MHKQVLAIWPLLVANFLDMLAYAMLSPVIIFLFVEGSESIFDPSYGDRHSLLGLFFSTFYLVQIISLPLWGKLSIIIGKKKVLIISILGGALGYFVCAQAVEQKEVLLLFLGSLIAGLTGANLSTTNALISQETDKKFWVQNFSLLSALIGLAFIVGPQLTRFIMKYFSNGGYSYYIFVIAMFLALTNILIVYFMFHENKLNAITSTQNSKNKETFLSLDAFRGIDSNLKLIFMFLFCMSFGWYFFIKFFQVYLIEYLHLNEEYCCHGSTYLGFCCALWQGIRYFLNPSLFRSKHILITCSFLMAFSLLAFIFVSTFVGVIAVTLSLSFAYSMMSPLVLSHIFHTGNTHKDIKSSLYQSVQGVVKIMAPLVSGYIMSMSLVSPIFLSFTLVLLAALLSFYYRDVFMSRIS